VGRLGHHQGSLVRVFPARGLPVVGRGRAL
jgi:hypothetical protein